MIRITGNVIVHIKDDKEHDRHLHKFIAVAYEHSPALNSGKSAVKEPSLTFLGCVYDKNWTHPVPAKFSVVHNLPPKRHHHSSRSSLAWSYYYHYLCLDFHPSLYLSVNCSRKAWCSNGINHTRKPLTPSNASSVQTPP